MSPKQIVLMLTSFTMLASSDLARAAATFDVAITVDDLTGNSILPPGVTRLDVAMTYLAHLRAWRVPRAYGFLNASKLRRDGDDVLRAWTTAGYLLGNHTFSHMNLDQAPSLAAWQADVVSGEPPLRRWMRHRNWRYFRYPHLSAGRDQDRHDEAIGFLKSRGYQIAEVTVSFDDWSYGDAYARCRTNGDAQAIAAMRSRYLSAVDTGIARMRALSMASYGRVIPQVLLMHLNAWSADTLPDVLTRLRGAGARFVTLAKAQNDPAYRRRGPRAGDQMLMERFARSKNIDVASIPRLPPAHEVEQYCR